MTATSDRRTVLEVVKEVEYLRGSSSKSRVSGINGRRAGDEEGSMKRRGTPKVGGDVNVNACKEWTKKAFFHIPAKHLIC